jgi:uncharacterized protein (DUF488 family)
MTTVCTIGYTQKTLERFIWLLQEAAVDAVIDIRLHNTSQLAGFSKRDDLAFLLREGFGIEYEHRLELAPTPEILDGYRSEGDWAGYERDFIPLLIERDAGAVGHEILDRYRRPCLLCAEPLPDHCHRRLVAEWWAAHLPGIEINHLV